MLTAQAFAIPGIDCAFDSRPKALIIEPDSAGPLFRLGKVLLHLRQNFCFFVLQEFLVQLLLGSAELKVNPSMLSVRDSMPSILSSLVIAKANTKLLHFTDQLIPQGGCRALTAAHARCSTK